MSFLNNLLVLNSLFLISFFASIHAARFHIINSCPFVVWAAALPGGGRRLNQDETWVLDVSPGMVSGRIWARTNCSFDAAGRGRCETGDCGGVLECKSGGETPNTMAEYALNQINNLDFFDISLVDGFNVEMDFSPTSPQCTRGPKCVATINDQCPNELRAPGGCNNPCSVFKTPPYCCNSRRCIANDFSRFFKERCPDAYSYPKDDDQVSTFTCPGGTVAEYAMYANTSVNMDISLLNGFNIPMEFSPAASKGTCRRIKCAADINGLCPLELRDPGGCNNPCTVFRNNQFCCYSGICQPTSYSKSFKDLCPDAYTYQYDYATGLFSCPNGSDYNVIFCP